MKAGFYPKMAVSGMRKNGRLYVPYIAACILMVAIYYIMHLLGFSDMLEGFSGAGTARDILKLGSAVIAVFGTIFLFYTQSTLIKGRLKEFGLYSVLGMNRKNLGKIIFFETLITWFVSVTAGLAIGIGLSKLAELGFRKMLGLESSYKFVISGQSISFTVLIYSIVFVLIFLNAARLVRFSRTINLINSDKAGEKPPKANWFVGILGLAILLTGYGIVLMIKTPLQALAMFFVAVILIIIGTYLVLIAGSVLLCRILQKNKRYYYKTNHFVSVSSMAYRMKRNGAGLASICILLTMVLVMMSSTSSLYVNREDVLQNHYPRQLNASVSNYGYSESYTETAERLEKEVIEKAHEFGAETMNDISLSCCSFSGYMENGRLRVDFDPFTMGTSINFDNVATVYFIDLEDYNRITGKNVVLGKGEVLAGVSGNIPVEDSIGIGDETFKVAKRIDVSTITLVVDDLGETASRYSGLKDSRGDTMLMWQWNFAFDTNLDEDKQAELGKILAKHIRDDLYPKEQDYFRVVCESRVEQRSDFVRTFGGLFYLGILLSIIFLVSCVLIRRPGKIRYHAEGRNDKGKHQKEH